MLSQCICLISVYIYYLNPRCWPQSSPARAWEDVSLGPGPKQPVAGHSEGLAVHSVSAQSVTLWASASFDHEETTTVASDWVIEGKKREIASGWLHPLMFYFCPMWFRHFLECKLHTALTSLIRDMLFIGKSVIAHVLCTCVVMVSDRFLNLLLDRRSTLPFPGTQEQYEVCVIHSQSIRHWSQLCIGCLYNAPILCSRCSSRVWWGIYLAREMMCSLKAIGHDLLNCTQRP